MPSSDDLTAEQLAELLKAIESQLHYVAKVKQRMIDLKWPDNDSLLVDMRLAQEALARLRMNLHYRQCESNRNQSSGK